ncbi:integrase [Thermococcus sp. Bubb.Bath]|uniref:integrase n=1 Tax=Thermococcus sp. Bubb.Bath TaxID=1638242 RepID=UPI001439846E|nr:integrase [Thermococcus sp. Bubb.Bath]NJF25353.1 hypothetical protein [Thermococcus sp. Bubb.Bath]
MVRWPGFEPGPAAWQTIKPQKRSSSKTKLTAELFKAIAERKAEFNKWIKTTSLQEKQKRNYSKAINRIMILYDLKKALKGSKTDRLALRKFIKFLHEKGYIDPIEYQELKQIIQLPKSGINTYIYTNEDIKQVLSSTTDPTKKLYLQLVISSGLRRSHARIAFNRLATGTEFKKLGDIAVLDLFISHASKRAFVCVCPAKLAEKIQQHGKKLSENQVHKLTQKGIKFNAIRKWFYTTARRLEIPPDIVDFWQGRAIKNIGAKHYLDMLEMTRKYYPHLLKELRKFYYD